jgi:hypothetical protein
MQCPSQDILIRTCIFKTITCRYRRGFTSLRRCATVRMWAVAASAVPGASVSGFCRNSANTSAVIRRMRCLFRMPSRVLSRRRRAVAGVGAAAHSSRNQSAARSSLGDSAPYGRAVMAGMLCARAALAPPRGQRGGFEFDVERALFAMVANRALAPCAGNRARAALPVPLVGSNRPTPERSPVR